MPFKKKKKSFCHVITFIGKGFPFSFGSNLKFNFQVLKQKNGKCGVGGVCNGGGGASALVVELL